MSFMQQDISDKTFGYSVETREGTYFVPGFVCGDLGIRGHHDETSRKFADLCKALQDYVGHGIESLERVTGYFARMSAPGYMDCTDWVCYASKREAMHDLRDMYGNE